AGAVVRLPRLAAAIAELVARGPDLLGGPVGAAIVRAVRARGGVLAEADLADHAGAAWTPCAEGAAGPYPAWTTPAPTHGPALLRAVAGAAPEAGAGDAYNRVLAAIATARETL